MVIGVCKKRCLIGLQLSLSSTPIKHLLEVNLGLIGMQFVINKSRVEESFLQKYSCWGRIGVENFRE